MRDLSALPFDSMEHMLSMCWQAERPLSEVLSAKTGPRSVAVEVYANHGRWLVEFPTCRAAQFASQEDSRFMCHCCANVGVGGMWRPVSWPNDRAVIEQTLSSRLSTENQNWIPSQTATDLRVEVPTEEPVGPREHALWAGFDAEGAEHWEQMCIEADEWLRAVAEEDA